MVLTAVLRTRDWRLKRTVARVPIPKGCTCTNAQASATELVSRLSQPRGMACSEPLLPWQMTTFWMEGTGCSFAPIEVAIQRLLYFASQPLNSTIVSGANRAGKLAFQPVWRRKSTSLWPTSISTPSTGATKLRPPTTDDGNNHTKKQICTTKKAKSLCCRASSCFSVRSSA